MRKRKESIRVVLGLTACILGLSIGVSAECAHEFVSSVTPPGCVEPGMYEEFCKFCGLMGKTHSIVPLGHALSDWEIAEDAECTKNGTQVRKCSRCELTETRPIPATGHHYDEGVLTKEPTETAMGRITYTCEDCGDTYNESVPKLTNPFVDVESDNYYYKGVLWAANAGVTAGVDASHFAPDQPCTRAEVVTFLWRAAGRPDASGKSVPFTDVEPNRYYTEAVAWAYHEGIAAGETEPLFVPDDVCTRGQVVSFLHRWKGRPSHGGYNPFTDIDPDCYYSDAVLWASENRVTSGVEEDLFAPEQICDRGQIVTFLYRARNL